MSRRRFIIGLMASLLSALFVFASYLNNAYPAQWPEYLYPFTKLLRFAQVPAIIIAALASSNSHQPNPIAVYLALFLIYMLLVIAVVSLIWQEPCSPERAGTYSAYRRIYKLRS